MKNINPTKTTAWNELKKHFKKIKSIHINSLFNEDPKRFTKFSIVFRDQILIDFSKNHITQETIDKLHALAKETDLKNNINCMFSGEKINLTENRAVLHVALRNRSNIPVILDKEDIMPKINNVLNKMKCFSEKIINGIWLGYTGKPIKDIVNIGIGGSHLGPLMVTEALKPYKNHLNIHFISNIDGSHITNVIENLNPETTLFLIASKTFKTQETLTNAYSARNWFIQKTGNVNNISKHFIALSNNITAVKEFGINTNNTFECWDWVGGRYSLWSSIGLSIVLSIGFDNFEQLLNGAHAMDKHFVQTPIEKNIPVLLALIGIWYNNFFGAQTEAILPYDQNLHFFATYFQQVNMESNGKHIDRQGNYVNYQTGPIIWGESGTNGQHSFYQLIHQGTKLIPCDFIAPVMHHHSLNNHHFILLSNFFAQTKSLAFGEKINKITSIVKNKKDNKILQKINLFKSLQGNRPSNSILIRKINPFNLGALIALYEHKIFTQGSILNIFSFDQWGVELGKQLADRILLDLNNKDYVEKYDSSTNSLINYYKNWREYN
ncbi:glucose-6-phosphate isomerase [Candidatus Pantoea edessiphila]|uniref:Glucose-6-phosphate isomerase n=1 Tax=Candidatus Pantoea edessiphila TaxID=2044610 RepID=A0A2P5SW14_9GAMM|nr:glucose-6-phosphate isomerase [Candidatus Pantoea edessiphila]PPI86525.1 glucose-6-phosphate isomerase [Candidatus Pantoea edessiphila]